MRYLKKRGENEERKVWHREYRSPIEQFEHTFSLTFCFPEKCPGLVDFALV